MKSFFHGVCNKVGGVVALDRDDRMEVLKCSADNKSIGLASYIQYIFSSPAYVYQHANVIKIDFGVVSSLYIFKKVFGR